MFNDQSDHVETPWSAITAIAANAIAAIPEIKKFPFRNHSDQSFTNGNPSPAIVRTWFTETGVAMQMFKEHEKQTMRAMLKNAQES